MADLKVKNVKAFATRGEAVEHLMGLIAGAKFTVSAAYYIGDDGQLIETKVEVGEKGVSKEAVAHLQQLQAERRRFTAGEHILMGNYCIVRDELIYNATKETFDAIALHSATEGQQVEVLTTLK